nr:FecR family protein [Pedobacter xinjiangensis]
MITAYAAQGKVKKVRLPDGSLVWINSKGSIKFPQQFSTTTRDVYIEEGEVFFEVKHNKKKPFIVHSGQLTTTVLGTSFNIKYYRDLQNSSISVQTGKVGVSMKGKHLSFLTPHQVMHVNKTTGNFSTTTSTISSFNGWISGDREFENASFDEIALALQNNYGVKLRYQRQRSPEYSYTVQMDFKQPIEHNINILCKMHNLNYRRTAHEITLY